MLRILPVFFSVLFIACSPMLKEEPSQVFFAGEIVNPSDTHVVLFKGDAVIDSARLDANNRFEFRIDSLEGGLYHFYHHPELQYVFFEGDDSLQIRLNTVDFDESLAFSGQGEEINNFLLDMFLANEQEEIQVYDYYTLEAEDFRRKIDSLKALKVDKLSELSEESDLSDRAYNIAKACILYSTYLYYEAYPFYHKRMAKENSIHPLPEDFYSYRNSIDYNAQDLIYLRPYYNFMKYHLGNLTYMNCRGSCNIQDRSIKNQLHFNKHKLHLIDSLIPHKELRDNLFRSVAVEYMLKQDSEPNYRQFITDFHEYSGGNRHLDEIHQLYQGILNIQPDKELPSLVVEDHTGEQHSIQEIAKGKKVVFYFWSGVERGHFVNISKRIAELKSKHPDYKFIGISLRTDKQRWRTMLEANKLDPSEQFWTGDYEKFAHTLVVYDPNKSIIAHDGKIVDAFANVYTSF